MMNTKTKGKRLLSLVLTICLLGGVAFSNWGTSEVKADDVTSTETSDTTKKLRELTFADFDIADGTYTKLTGSCSTIAADKQSSFTLADTVFSGYIQMKDTDTMKEDAAYFYLGTTAWGGAGLGIYFEGTYNRLQVDTSGITEINAERLLFNVPADFFETQFKLTVSLETVTIPDVTNTAPDLILKVYLNDQLLTNVTNVTNSNQTLSDMDGAYYIRDYKTDKLPGVMTTYNIGSDVRYKSIAVKSCFGEDLLPLSFRDFGIANDIYSSRPIGKIDIPLANTIFSGKVDFCDDSGEILAYAEKTRGYQDGIWVYHKESGKINFHANYLGLSYSNGGFTVDEKTLNMDFESEFTLSIGLLAWDYEGTGKEDDVKIFFLIDGNFVGKCICLVDAFAAEENLGKYFSISSVNNTKLNSTEAVMPDTLRKLTLADFGFASGTYASRSRDVVEPSTLLNTSLEVNVNVKSSTGGSRIHYAVPHNNDGGGEYGIYFTVGGDSLTIGSWQNWIEADTIKATEIERTTFYDAPFKLGVSVELISIGTDGAMNDVRLGICLDGQLLRTYYLSDMASTIGTGMTIIPYLNGDELNKAEVTLSNIEYSSVKFEPLTLADVTAYGIAPGVYGDGGAISDRQGLYPTNYDTKDASVDGKIFTTNIRFSGNSERLYYGSKYDNGDYALTIGPNDKGELTIQYINQLLQLQSSTPRQLSINEGIAGVRLIDDTYKLGISTRNVDCDGDGAFDDLEVGLWINDKLYSGSYGYLVGLADELDPNIGVTSIDQNNKGYIVLGDYTQSEATEVVHCADEYGYFVDGDTVTIGETESEGSKALMNPGIYDVTYTDLNSTFREKVTVYKTNDLDGSGDVDVRDLVRLKNVFGQKEEIDTIGKYAIQYDESTSTEAGCIEPMYNALLEDKNKIQAKKMPESIKGATGSKNVSGEATYITNLATTEEGTSVISISDIASEADRTYTTKVEELNGCGLDFVLDFDTDREIRVLQLTDTQIIDSDQRRTKDTATDNRLSQTEITTWAPDQMDAMLFDELDKLIKQEKPDLILLTGDLVYGEFDDDGTSFDKLIQVLDSYKIPWAPIFGNHDNESAIGVAEQCRRFVVESSYCLFNRRNEIGGNGNYSIGIAVQGDIQRTIYMMDSNGCSNTAGMSEADKEAITTQFKFHDKQMAWYRTVAETVNNHVQKEIPSLMCFHVGAAEVTTAVVEKGYQSIADTISTGNHRTVHKYTLGMEPNEKGDFGFKYGSSLSSFNAYIYPELQAAGTDGVFVGHQHMTSLSINWKDIRWTYGLKTGQYDEHPEQTGGTMITLQNNDFDVKHVIITDSSAS